MNRKLKFLKIKIKSLAEEARIIRAEKRKAKAKAAYAIGTEWRPDLLELVDELHNHRIRVVRPETRVALLAYGLLRGQTRDQIEPGAKTEVDAGRLAALVKKYGTREDVARLLPVSQVALNKMAILFPSIAPQLEAIAKKG